MPWIDLWTVWVVSVCACFFFLLVVHFRFYVRCRKSCYANREKRTREYRDRTQPARIWEMKRERKRERDKSGTDNESRLVPSLCRKYKSVRLFVFVCMRERENVELRESVLTIWIIQLVALGALAVCLMVFYLAQYAFTNHEPVPTRISVQHKLQIYTLHAHIHSNWVDQTAVILTSTRRQMWTNFCLFSWWETEFIVSVPHNSFARSIPIFDTLSISHSRSRSSYLYRLVDNGFALA